jgi:hypothetical protein
MRDVAKIKFAQIDIYANLARLETVNLGNQVLKNTELFPHKIRQDCKRKQ